MNTGNYRRLKGHIADLIGQADIMQAGYNVFKIIIDNGDIDFIAEKDGILLKMQVKSESERHKGRFDLTKRHAETKKCCAYADTEIDFFVLVNTQTADVYLVKNEGQKSLFARNLQPLKIFPLPNYTFPKAKGKADRIHGITSKPTKAGNKTSAFKGVGFEKKKKKWRAAIFIGNKYKNLGLYDTEIGAAKAYNTFIAENNLQASHYLNELPE